MNNPADLDSFDWFRPHSVTLHIDRVTPEAIKILQGETSMTDPNQRRELDGQGHQLANLAEGDPGNTDPELLVAPLDPDDDVFALVHPDHGDIETAPAGD